MSKRVFIFQKLFTLAVLGFALFMATIYTPVVMAHSRSSQTNFEEVQAVSALSPPFSALEFTAVTTTYLPIIVRNPGPVNSPSVAANCIPTQGSGGLKPGSYKTTVAGLEAVVIVGKGYDPKRATYLGFNLHGDGGGYDMVQKANNPLRQFANKRSWVLVSPLAPNGESWWTNFVGDHKQALARVFEEMFAKYNLCRNIIFGTTGSGGAEFWSSQFFPAKGAQYPAHTILACGGSRGPRNKINTLGKNPNLVARSRLYYIYGTKDRLAPIIRQSIQTYTGAGFHVKVKVLDGAGHCNKWKPEGLPSWHEWTASYWTEIDNLLRVN